MSDDEGWKMAVEDDIRKLENVVDETRAYLRRVAPISLPLLYQFSYRLHADLEQQVRRLRDAGLVVWVALDVGPRTVVYGEGYVLLQLSDYRWAVTIGNRHSSESTAQATLAAAVDYVLDLGESWLPRTDMNALWDRAVSYAQGPADSVWTVHVKGVDDD